MQALKTPKVGILLCRNPLVLPRLPESTRSYLLSRQADSNAQARLFDASFYYKKGTLAEQEWRDAQELATEGYAQPAELELRNLTTKHVDGQPLDAIARKRSSKVYLVVKNTDWRLAEFPVENEQILSDANAAHLTRLVANAETWTVGNKPVGHYESAKDIVYLFLTQTFYLKSYVVKGTPQIDAEHAWLTKEECKEKMSSDYYEAIQGMLTTC